MDELEAAIMQGLGDPASVTDAGGPVGDLMNDFIGDLTKDLPVQDPNNPEPPKSDDAPVEEQPKEEPVVEDQPKEEPKAEEPAKDDEGVPEKPKVRADWDTLRASRDRHKASAEEREKFIADRDKTIAEIRAENEQLKAKAARAAELEEREKIYEEQEKELAVARIEATVEFKNAIGKPLTAIGEAAKVLAESNEGDISAIQRMLKEADPAKQRNQLKEITAGWDEIDKAELREMASNARTLYSKWDDMSENAHAAQEEQKKLATQRETESKAAVLKEFKAASTSVVQQLREKVPFIALADGETEDDRYNALVKKLEAVDFDGQSPRSKAFAAAAALNYAPMVRMIEKLQAQVAQLESGKAKDAAKKPSVNPNTEVKPPAKEEDFLTALGVPSMNPFQSQSLNVQGE